MRSCMYSNEGPHKVLYTYTLSKHTHTYMYTHIHIHTSVIRTSSGNTLSEAPSSGLDCLARPSVALEILSLPVERLWESGVVR